VEPRQASGRLPLLSPVVGTVQRGRSDFAALAKKIHGDEVSGWLAVTCSNTVAGLWLLLDCICRCDRRALAFILPVFVCSLPTTGVAMQHAEST
jgi:hypothetical protein